MRCSVCDSSLSEGAAYCVQCGAAIAATGQTVTLEQPLPSISVPVAPGLPALQLISLTQHRRRLFDGSWRPLANGMNGRSGAIFLIGLGLLFFTGHFWPWILALVGVTGAVEHLADGDTRHAVATLVLLVGLAVLSATGFFWPGILILLGVVALLDRV